MLVNVTLDNNCQVNEMTELILQGHWQTSYSWSCSYSKAAQLKEQLAMLAFLYCGGFQKDL